MPKSIMRISIILLLCILSFCCGRVGLSAERTLSWQPNTESDLAGYEIHYGDSTGNYQIKIVMPKALNKYTVGGLEQGKEYFFAIAAFDTSGNISSLSSEISAIIPVLDIISPTAPTVIQIPDGSAVEININP